MRLPEWVRRSAVLHGTQVMPTYKVLFLSTANSARSIFTVERRIELLPRLPHASLDTLQLKSKVAEISIL
jgi:hypothetical protein